MYEYVLVEIIDKWISTLYNYLFIVVWYVLHTHWKIWKKAS